jgi:hypothetical protein
MGSGYAQGDAVGLGGVHRKAQIKTRGNAVVAGNGYGGRVGSRDKARIGDNGKGFGSAYRDTRYGIGGKGKARSVCPRKGGGKRAGGLITGVGYGYAQRIYSRLAWEI